MPGIQSMFKFCFEAYFVEIFACNKANFKHALRPNSTVK